MTNQLPDIKDIKKVLKDTKKVVEHHRELTVAKGEHFNLFSVLDIETKENKTHSAFLAELLNPRGVHGLGTVFLKHFLDAIGHKKELDLKNTKVKVEVGIGKIKLYAEQAEKCKSSGGRIDIYIKDTSGNIISIENKIHALDQEAQIQRYCNHETNKNTVYYLTLEGKEPTKFSKIDLISGEDFYNISYKSHIIDWLELCLREVPNFTSLREAINQYILLIKKLTHTLNKQAEQELFEAMTDNIEASKTIAFNYEKLVNKIREKFRRDVKAKLESVLDFNCYNIVIGKPIDAKFAQLWLLYKGRVNHSFKYGIEPFSGKDNKDGKMFIGICGTEEFPSSFNTEDLNHYNSHWQHVHYINTAEGNSLNLNSSVLLKRINDEKEKKKYEAMLEAIIEQVQAFIKDTETQLGFTNP